jgi:hypothetical protein
VTCNHVEVLWDIPRLLTLSANYRMKLTRLGHRFARGLDSPFCPGWLAEARLGLQLMRGRYTAVTNP